MIRLKLSVGGVKEKIKYIVSGLLKHTYIAILETLVLKDKLTDALKKAFAKNINAAILIKTKASEVCGRKFAQITNTTMQLRQKLIAVVKKITSCTKEYFLLKNKAEFYKMAKLSDYADSYCADPRTDGNAETVRSLFYV